MNFRPYQLPAAEYLTKRKRGMVQAPAGSGKTVIAAAALCIALKAKHRDCKVKAGWMANTQEQVAQAHAALALFPDIARLADVTVACAAAGTDWSSFGVLIVDEAHHAPAPEWQRQIQSCSGAIWGMTATPPEPHESRHEPFCELFGSDWHIIKRKDVGENLARAKVFIVDSSDTGLRELIDADIDRTVAWRRRYWRGGEGELWGQVAWQSIIKLGIVENGCRNMKAIELARKHSGDQALMLVNQIEHAEWFAENIPNSVACFSKMGKKKRAAALDAFKAGTVKCLIATSLADEGLDLPNADTLILVSGGRSKRLAEQRSGRVLRSFAGKSHGRIYDFADTFHPLAAKQSRARQDTYRELGYEFA